MWFLASSIAALAVAPLLYGLARRRTATMGFLDGVVMVSVSALVIAHILPEAIHATGPIALVLAALGFLGPTWLETALRRAANKAHGATVIVALLGLALHALLDGVALADQTHPTTATAVAVALHRLPVGITIWWLLSPSMGRPVAAFVLTCIAAATVGGFASAGALEHLLHDSWTGSVQALVGGALLHVVIHRPAPMGLPKSDRTWRRGEGLGALIGIVFSIYIADSQHNHSGMGHTFLTLAEESAPALALAFLLAGIVQALLPSASLGWMRTGRAPTEAVRGLVFGLPLPICSCGVVPLYESLVARAVPATAAMAFLVATPELGIDAILISVPLLGGELTLVRIAGAAVVALLIGWLVGRRVAPSGSVGEESPPVGSWPARLRQGLRYGLVEIVDHVGPWIVFGVAIAALIDPILSAGWLTGLPWGVDVFVFALIGMPSYVCASGATPLAAVLIAHGVSPGAAIAFLLSGPGTNVTTFGVLSRLHGRGIAVLFGATLLALGVGLGLLVNALMGDVGLSIAAAQGDHDSWLSLAALAVLGVLFGLSILRQGARGFIGQVLTPYQDDDHCHDHSH